MFGAMKDDLPAIWEELNDAGFESGQVYGKSLRMVKSCVGTTCACFISFNCSWFRLIEGLAIQGVDTGSATLLDSLFSWNRGTMEFAPRISSRVEFLVVWESVLRCSRRTLVWLLRIKDGIVSAFPLSLIPSLFFITDDRRYSFRWREWWHKSSECFHPFFCFPQHHFESLCYSAMLNFLQRMSHCRGLSGYSTGSLLITLWPPTGCSELQDGLKTWREALR